MTAPATLDHAGIAARIPHAGRMCLLDALLGWSATHIQCTATGHADADHPLRDASGLPTAVAIEYAAQAMALHGGLLAPPGSTPAAGYIASVRGVSLHGATLHQRPGPLAVRAERLAGDAQQVMYAFQVHDGQGAPVAEGRATVVLNTPLPAPTDPLQELPR